MKQKYIILLVAFFASTDALAEVSCGGSSCSMDSGDKLNKDIYIKTNNKGESDYFIGNHGVMVQGINDAPLSKVVITGLAYGKLDVNVTYTEEAPFEISLKTPQFGILSPIYNSLLENGIFSAEDEGDGVSTVKNNTIKNAIFFSREGVTDNNTLINSQMVVSNRSFIYGGHFYGDYLSDTKITNNKYTEGSSEIIISDSNANRNLSSSYSIFNDTSEQYLSGIVFTTNPTFNGDSTQILKNKSYASDVTLNNNSTSTVYNSAKQTGTTTVNGAAQLILTTGSENRTSTDAGASAEKVVLNSQDSQLVIDSGSTGDTAFADSISGDGKVILSSNTYNYSNLVTDNISGNQSYYFATDIKNQAGSTLTINESSSGDHTVFVANNGAADTDGTEKTLLVEDKSGTNANASFNSRDNKVELGGYLYTVTKDGNTNNWYLTGIAKDPTDPTVPTDPTDPTIPTKPVINNTAKTITGLASTSYLMNQAEMMTLRQRMGDLTRAKKSTSADVSGAWGRVYGGNYKTRNNDNLAKADMNYYGFQLGGDINTVHYSDTTNYLGVFMGHTTGKPNYDRGDATETSWYGGLYDTLIMDNGFYVDSVVKLGQYRNKYNLKDSQDNAVNGKANSNVITLSSQVGKRFMLTEKDKYNVYAEPQAQLTYSRIGTFNTTASNGLRVKQDAYNSTEARLGVLLGTQINKQSDIYLKTSYLHEFSKDVNYKLNNSQESYSVKGNGLEAGLGVNVKLNDNGYLYAEADYINSQAHYTGSKFNIGYRYSF